MRGSVRKRGETWTWYLWVPDPLTGKPCQRTKGGYHTKRECQDGLNEALARLREGTFVKPSPRVLRAFLVDEWLPAARPPRVRPSTWASYRMAVERHIVPGLGGVVLQGLTPAHLTAFYRALLTGGRQDGRGGLAPKTVRNLHGVLHAALRDAARWGYLARNVADAADLPKGSTPEMRVWSPEQLRAFLAHVRADEPFAAWVLFATTGMRRGRGRRAALGRRRPGRRPRLAPPAPGRQLRGRRLRAQDGQGPPLPGARPGHGRGPARAPSPPGRAAARGRPRWQDSGLVFTWPDGRAIHPQRFSNWFEQHTRAAGLPRIRLHDVRHSYATAALAAGIPAKVVSERLGHANIAITMDTYSHVLPGLDEHAAGTVARLILGDDDDQPPARPIDKPLTTGPKAPTGERR